MSQSIKRAPLVFNPALTWILLAACYVAPLKPGRRFVEIAFVQSCRWSTGFVPSVPVGLIFC